MRVKSLLLLVLLGLLFVQVALAATAAKDAKGAAPTKDAPKATKEAVKEPVDVPKTTKDAPKDAPKEVPKEAPKEAPKAAAKEAPKEVPKESPKDVPKEAPKEVPKEAPKEVPKEAPKEAKAKEAPKAKDVPRFPKEAEPTQKKGDAKPEASFMDTYDILYIFTITCYVIVESDAKETEDLIFSLMYLRPMAQEYAQQAYATAQVYGKQANEYGQVAWKEARKYGGAAAVLAQEYSVVMADAVSDYTDAIQEHTYKHSVDLVDQFLDPHHAKIIKKNYLNWYGVGLIVADLVAIFFVVKHLRWVFSLSTLRVFLISTSLGVYITLATLSILGDNPTKGISASTMAAIHSGLFYTAILITVLNVWALLAYPGTRQKSFVVVLLSVGLFLDQLELRVHLEESFGSIPLYTLEALIFLLQAILVFDSINSSAAPTKAQQPKKAAASSPSISSPSFIKEEKIKQEKKSGKGK